MRTRKQALLLDVGGAITFDAPESGVLSSTVVSVFDHAGEATAIAATAVAAVNGRRLSHTVSAAICDTLGSGYRVLWQYTAGSEVAVQHSRLFAVVNHVLRPSLNGSSFFGSYYPGLSDLVPDHVSLGVAIDRAWDEVFERLEQAGLDPHRVIDASGLEAPHADLTAAHVLRQLGPGYTEQAQAAWALGRERLMAAAGSLRFYNADDDEELKPGASELDAAPGGLTALRG